MTNDRLSNIADDNGRPVAHYRVQILTPDKQIINTDIFRALGDESALAIAGAMVDGHAIELWDDLRFIERFEPRSD